MDTELDLEAIVDGWIKYNTLDMPERDTYWTHVSMVMDWNVDQPELVWNFILSAYQRDIGKTVIADLAAGPLEDLLVKHGTLFIDRVITLAKQDSRFSHMLGGVWKNAMVDDVWNAVVAVRSPTW